MDTKQLPQATLGPVAQHSVSDSSGGDDANPAKGRFVFPQHEGKQKGAASDRAALCSNLLIFCRTAQALVGVEAHGPMERQNKRRLLFLDRSGKALTTLPATGGNDLAATLGGHTGAKPELAGALQFGRCVGGLHSVSFLSEICKKEEH
jgi:hypothetical protein